MVGIVITGHGHFPGGILSAVELVAGKQDRVIGVDFEAGQSSGTLKEALTAAVGGMEGEEVLILSDLVGGTPFNMAAEVKQELKGKHIRLLAGTNMAMVVEAVFSRMGVGLDTLAEMAAEAGAKGVVDFDRLGDVEEKPQFEDGI